MKVQLLSKFPVDSSDQQSETPNYVKAYDNLYRLIIEGVIKDGDKLPSENAMAKHWGVSRGTIRMAMKRLEEDGYINKSQGKRATVATYAMHKRNSINWLYNLCLEDSKEPITKVRMKCKYQKCGKYVANEMGKENSGFLTLAVVLEYYQEEEQVAISTVIFDVHCIEKYHIDIENKEFIKKFASEEIYKISRRARTVLSVVQSEGSSKIKGLSAETPVIVFEEILLGENDTPQFYCKHRLNALKYRFSLERKAPF